MNSSPPNSEPAKDAASSGGWQQGFKAAAPYMGLGFQMVMTMVLFAAGGYYLDQWLGTAPWLLLVGLFLGMVSVFTYLIRLANDLGKKSSARSTNDPDESSDDFS